MRRFAPFQRPDERRLPRLNLLAEFRGVHIGLFRLGKDFVFFFFNVVADNFAEHVEFRCKLVIARRHLAQFLHKQCCDVVFFARFIDQVLLFDGIADGGIDELLLQRGMNRQFPKRIFRNASAGAPIRFLKT